MRNDIFAATMIAAFLAIINYAIGFLIGVLSNKLNMDLSGALILTCFIPPFLVGMFFGKSNKGKFSTKFRLQLFVMYGLASVVMAVVILRVYFSENFLEDSNYKLVQIAIIPVMVGTIAAYFSMLVGEMAGIKISKSKE